MGDLTRMRTQFLKGFCAALLLAVVVWSICQFPGQREPAYQGRPLTFWLSKQQASWMQPGSPSRIEADHAIRSIGTNALPILMKWTLAKDSPVKRKLMAWAKKQSLIKIRFHPDEEYHAKADAGYKNLLQESH